MRNGILRGSLLTIALLLALIPAPASAREVVQEWELLNPAGAFKIIPLEPAPRIRGLDR